MRFEEENVYYKSERNISAVRKYQDRDMFFFVLPLRDNNAFQVKIKKK